MAAWLQSSKAMFVQMSQQGRKEPPGPLAVLLPLLAKVLMKRVFLIGDPGRLQAWARLNSAVIVCHL